MTASSLSVHPSLPEKIADLKARKFWITDLDGTLYPYAPDFHRIVNSQIAKAATKLGFNGTRREAMRIARRSYGEHGHSTTSFGIDHDLSVTEIYNQYHRNLDPMIIRMRKADFESIQNFHDIFLTPDLKPDDAVILTASTNDWAIRAVERIGLSSIFNPSLGKIVDANDTMDANGKLTFKDKDQWPYDVAMKRLNCDDPSLCVMFEDSVRNLRIPHEMGMFTIYVHHGDPLPATKLPPYVDLQIKRAGDLKNLLTP